MGGRCSGKDQAEDGVLAGVSLGSPASEGVFQALMSVGGTCTMRNSRILPGVVDPGREPVTVSTGSLPGSG